MSLTTGELLRELERRLDVEVPIITTLRASANLIAKGVNPTWTHLDLTPSSGSSFAGNRLKALLDALEPYED